MLGRRQPMIALMILLALPVAAAAAPTISTLTPTSGAIGASVTIAGTGFGATQGTSTVKFNGTSASVTSWSATSLVTTAPIGATSGNVVVTVSGAASAGKAFTVAATPSITTLTPTSAAVGASITITGSNFGASQGTGLVKFNGTTATITSWGASSIVATVPGGATTGNVVVRASGVDSAGKAFTVAAAPSITSVTPTTGAVGAAVTIAGSNFGATQGTGSVKFNGTTATITNWSATSIVAAVPSGATTGNVVVRASGVDSGGQSFSVVAAPSITTLTPTSGTVGASVTIAGSNFGATQGTGTVKFNGTLATITSWSAASIVAAVPAGATNGNVVVRASGVDSGGKAFTVLASPTITSLTPNSGAVTATVTIAGSNFGATQGTSTVKFNGTPATITTWSASSIATKVPAGATSGNVVVHTSVDSNGLSFTVLPTPTLSTLSPSSGAVGAVVTISGTNFGSSQGTSTVKFNGITATATSWGATSIAATVPTSATNGNVVVTVSGVASAGAAFAVVPKPNITSRSPTSGVVGTPVTLTGTNFGATQGSGTVSFNGMLATPTSWSATSIQVPVPAGATTGNIVVHASGVDSNGTTFTVIASPSISSLTPNFGPVGAMVTISGTNFGAQAPTSKVYFDGWLATPCATCWSATSISVAVPPNATTGLVVVKVNAILSSGVSFTVLPTPVIAGLSAASGGVGSTIVVSGGPFGASQGTSTLSLNGTAVPVCGTCWSDTTIAATVPIGAATGMLVVTVNGVQSNGAAFTVAPLTSLAVYPNVVTIAPTGTQQITATGLYSDGSSLDVSTAAMWTSSDSGVATVSATGLITGVAYGQTLVNASFGGFDRSVAIAVRAPSFVPTGGMNRVRHDHTATVLADGKVLIAGGGVDGVGPLSSAELYDPTTGIFVVANSLGLPRIGHVSTRLNDGRVLIAGGSNNDGYVLGAELYDPATLTFTTTGSLTAGRYAPTATLLGDGKVLILGGSFGNTGDVYDPVTGAFTNTGTLITPRSNQSATLLSSGKVLLAGGIDQNGNIVSSAELYDPTSGTFATTGSLMVARMNHAAASLQDGKVLLAGGTNGNTGSAAYLASAELYDPATGTFAPAGTLTDPRTALTATRLNSGLVLLAGGYAFGDSGAMAFNTDADLYYPATGTIAATGSMIVSRTGMTASLLDNGRVLMAGGGYQINTAELYQPTDLTSPPGLVSMGIDPIGPSIVAGTPQVFTASGVFADGTLQDMTHRVAWASSASSVATVSAIGLATAASPGVTTISATSGAVSASTSLTVVPVQLVSMAVTVQPDAIMLVNQTRQLTAIGTYNDGSSADLSPSVTWSSTAPAFITVNATGLTTGVAVGHTTVMATLGAIQGTSPWLYVYAAIDSLSVTPATGTIAIGGTTPLSAVGTSASGNLYVTTESDWTSSNASVASVSGGSVHGVSTGTATITATYNYFGTVFAASATVNVTTEHTAPQIFVSTSPSFSPGGFTHQNTVVTFTCKAGGWPIASCTNPVTVSTEGVNQLVTGTVTDTAGTAVSASVTLSIDKTKPSLVVTSPADGTTFTSSSLTVAGTVSDALSNVASVQCNQQAATVTSGTFSCNIGLNVGMNTLVVSAMDGAGNVSSTILHLRLTGTFPTPASLRITPATNAMLVGDRRQLTAVDELGRQRGDAAWTLDSPTLATITTSNPIELTAVAAGTVTVTATIQGVTANATVMIVAGGAFVPGTVLWSAPATPGYVPTRIVQAVPSAFGPDAYSIEQSSDGTLTSIQAYTSDGLQLWQDTVYSKLAGSVVPDANGGLVIVEACDPNDPSYSPMAITNLDGATGRVLWQRPLFTANYCLPGAPRLAVRGDGAIAVAMPLQVSPPMIVIDGLTGAEIFRPTIPPSTLVSQFGSTSSDGFSPVGQPIIDSDGSIHVEYAVRQIQPNQSMTSVLSLLTITAEGSTSARELSTSTIGNLWPGQVIPDGQSGLLATWVASATHPYRAAHVLSGSVTLFDMPLAPEIAATDPRTNLPLPLPLVLGELANSAFVSYGTDLVAFDLTSGNATWSYSASPLPLAIVASEANGGVAATTTNADGTQTVLRFSAAGAPTTAAWSGKAVNHYVEELWTDATATAAISMRTAETLDLSTTEWFSPNPRGMWAALSPFPRVRVNCRPLEGAFGLLADHCYLVSQRSDSEIRYIESGPTDADPGRPYGQNLAGGPYSVMPEKDAAAVITWKWFWTQATPALLDCLTAAVATWNQANITYVPLGPNSNSFAGWIVRECRSPARPSPFARAVGWLDLPLFQP